MQHHTVVVFTRNNARIINGVETGALAQYAGWKNVLVDPDLSTVSGTAPHFWKIYDGIAIPLTKEEQISRLKDINKNGLDNEIKFVKPRIKRFHIPNDFAHYIAYLIIIGLLICILGRELAWY